MNSGTLALHRRALLVASGALLLGRTGRAALAEGFDTLELSFSGGRGFARATQVVVPRAPAAPRSLPVVVLLHGLGETSDARSGMFAWTGRYGLGRAWERLASPPIAREREPYLDAAELAALNQTLDARPFTGLVVVCPSMPNPNRMRGPETALDAFAECLTDEVLPAVRARVTTASPAPALTGLAGVSLGGRVALDLYLRRPEAFRTVGTVQGAYGVDRAVRYAERLANAPGALAERAVYVATSSTDPYRAANDRLARELEKRGVPSTFSLRKGPHTQGWLREIGSLELLLWKDRALRGHVAATALGMR
ncbi:MAG TPA: alpha/beta hydrolase-fold protein [Polyangiaceae bacterium]|nr:alpha/beta hydrolase-fold protein [Polyangiaceae bacterium]